MATNSSFTWILVAMLGLVMFVAATGVVRTMFCTLRAQRKLKRDSRGLKMLPGLSLLDGHFRYYNTGTMDMAGPMFEQLNKLGKNILFMLGRYPGLVTVDLDFIKRLTVDEQRVHTARLTKTFPLAGLTSEGLIFTNGDKTSRIRKYFVSSMSGKRVKSEAVTGPLERSLDRLIGVIEAKLDEKPSSRANSNSSGHPRATLNVDDYLHRFSVDFVLNCFLGQDNLVDFKADKDPIVSLMDGSIIVKHPWTPLFFVLDFIDLMSLLNWFLLRFTSFGSFCKRLVAFVDVQEESRRVEKSQGRDNHHQLMAPLLDSFHEGKLTRNEMSHTMFSTIFASDKSLTNPLAVALYQLASHPDIQEKLRLSVVAYGRDSEYLGWVINETLRLMPPVSLGCSRTLERNIKTTCGSLVPEGTFVLTPLNIIHRLKELWGPDAEEFRPERFENQHEFHPCKYMPFGMGARICPAKEFSLNVIKTTLIKLLTRYKLSVDHKKQNEGYASAFFIFSVANEVTRINFEPIVA